nr:MAG TPA: hypothetical protein [Caudoviricetes sp.]
MENGCLFHPYTPKRTVYGLLYLKGVIKYGKHNFCYR